MAQRTLITLLDDLHGGPADETIEFALDGKLLEIDLDEANATRLRDTLADYIAAARRIGGRRTSTGRRTPASAAVGAAKVTASRFSESAGTPRRTVLQPDAASVRAWAKRQKIPLNPRGRIPKDVVERYLAATKRRRK